MEAGGRGAGLGENAATLATGVPGCCMARTPCCCRMLTGRSRRRIRFPPGSIIPAWARNMRCCEIGRVSYIRRWDDDALEAAWRSAAIEGILPAIECAHALVGARRWARQQSRPTRTRRAFRSRRQGHADAQQMLAPRPGTRTPPDAPAQRLSEAIRGAVAVWPWWRSSRRVSRHASASVRTSRPSPTTPTWWRSACRSPIPWPMASPSSARAALHCAGREPEVDTGRALAMARPRAQLVLMGYFNPLLTMASMHWPGPALRRA